MQIECDEIDTLLRKEARREPDLSLLDENAAADQLRMDQSTITGKIVTVRSIAPDFISALGVQTVHAAIIRAKQHLAFDHRWCESDGTLGKKTPEFFSGRQIETVKLIVARGTQINFPLRNDRFKATIKGDPRLEILFAVPKVLAGRRWPGRLGARTHLTVPCQVQR